MVYVDNFYVTGITFRGMKMSHMIADDTTELLLIAEAIGVNTKWIQHPDTCNEHFDICLAMRKKAIAFGATEINFREYAERVNNLAKKHNVHWALASTVKIR